jgi:tetratricopeptide (TPR) repeat protein
MTGRGVGPAGEKGWRMPGWLLRRARSPWTWALLVLLGLLAAAAGYFLSAESHLRAARRALERRAYAEARAHLDRYLAVWPRDPTAHLLAARCARGAGDFDEAERLIAACGRLGADREAVALEFVLLHAQRGTLDRADLEALWHRVGRRDPAAPRILEALAEGSLYTHRPDEAMAYLERWLADSPGDAHALYLRGLAWEARQALPRAGEDYRRAVERDPGHARAKKRLAEYLVYAGEAEEAAGLFGQLLEREPEDAALVLGLARCRHLQGRFAEARELLAPLLARDSPPVPALVERARLSQEEDDYSDAAQWYREALARDPFERDACYGLGQCLRALGRPEEARVYQARNAEIERDIKSLTRLYERMAERPDDPELPYEAGRICLRNGQKGEARRWFRNVLQLDPRHAGARRGLEEAVRN